MRTTQHVLVALVAIALTTSGCKPKASAPEPVQEEKTAPAEVDEEAPGPATGKPAPAGGKNVVMIIACKDFRDEELETPKKILEDAGHDVTVASTSTEGCKGMMGAEVDPDVLLEDVEADDYDAMIFVGGTGSSDYYENEQALELARAGDKEGLVVGAICLAPGILARAGVLKGKKATAYDADIVRKAFEEGGADYTGSKVTVDGVMVTGNGPEAAQAFGEKIAQMLE